MRESQSVSISSLRWIVFSTAVKIFTNVFVREFLMLDVKDWMKEVTGIHLNDHVDATCSIYRSTGRMRTVLLHASLC